jgi:anti-anti-sigma factor
LVRRSEGWSYSTTVTDSGTNNPNARWELTLAQGRETGALVVAAGGRLPAAATPRLAEAMAEAIASGDRRIVLDLRELDYISSAGIMALEVVAARLRTEGGELVLRGPTPPVRLALELSGFPQDVKVLG